MSDVRRLVLPFVACVALLVRVVPLLSRGGLLFWGRYDDGVYYAASASLLAGRVPYRDFVLLHPPLIMLVLAPFALLGRLTSDPVGLLAARLTWMLLGTGLAVLAARYAARWGTLAGLAAGLWVACSSGASYASQTTFIEPAADTALFGAVVLLTCDRVRPRHELVAGVLLGMALTGKIWYVAPVGALLLALLVSRRASALRAGAAACVTAAAILLPFFVLAPRDMWHMVVYDQIGRPTNGRTGLLDRLGTAVGGRGLGLGHPDTHIVTFVATAALLVAVVACLRDRQARLVAAVAIGAVGVLMFSPIVFHHYGAFPAAGVGATMGIGWSLVGPTLLRPVVLRRAAAWVAIAAVAGCGVLVLRHPLGLPFPRREVDARLPAGCITSDDPTTLILANRLSSDLRAHCDVAVDVTGASYGVRIGRGKNLAFQDWLTSYLRSGSAMILARRTHDRMRIDTVPSLGTMTFSRGIVHVIRP